MIVRLHQWLGFSQKTKGMTSGWEVVGTYRYSPLNFIPEGAKLKRREQSGLESAMHALKNLTSYF